MTKLILTRHGQTDYNFQRRYQGHSNIPLNATGLRQAEALRDKIATMKLSGVYTSDLIRASDTARVVMESHPSGLPVNITPGLREIGGGIIEGMTWDEQKAKFGDDLTAWYNDRANHAPPGGETLKQVSARLQKTIDGIIAHHHSDDDTVLLVVHGGVVGLILSHYMGMDLNHLWKWRVDSCSISIIDIYKDNEPILGLFNDVAHINAVEGLQIGAVRI